MDRLVDVLLGDLLLHGFAERWGIGLAQHAESTWRCNEDEGAGFPVRDRPVQPLGKRDQELLLILIVPVGLVDAAAPYPRR